MSAYDDMNEYRQEEALNEFLEEQLNEIASRLGFAYLAKYGDAIEKRVRCCIEEATALRNAGFFGAALIRSTAAIEITIRFFLAKPLLYGAFLSDEWADTLSDRILKERTAEDRGLLPAILQNWGIDITKLLLSDRSQVWEKVKKRVWPRRNDYVHAGASVEEPEAVLAAECLDALLKKIVDPISVRLGFTRDQTGCWSVVISKIYPELNPPRRYETASPFDKKECEKKD
jgi:hypothetical protein